MADSLLDQAASDPIGGLMSLLAPIVSGGAVTPPRGQLLSPDQIDQSTPAWLAFAQRMAQAGAPTLGPPVSTAAALTGAMGAGYSAERQAQMLPLLVSGAQREQEAAQLALDQQRQMNPLAVQAAQQAAREKDIAIQKSQFELDRERYLGGIERGVLGSTGGGAQPSDGAGAGPAGGVQPSAGPRSDLGPPAGASDIAALADVQRLPDQTRVPFIQSAAQIGMPAPVAAQYARMVMQEGQGLHLDPETGKPWVSSGGAVGAAGVEPGTFRDMQNKYGFAGNLTDLMPNLLAGGHYFMDQVSDHGMHGGVIAYNAGPGGLQRYLASGKLPAETADYLTKTGAPGADATTMAVTAPADLAQSTARPVLVAGPGAPTEPDAPASVTPAAPAAGLVRDPLSGAMVPPDVLRTARAAVLSPGPPGTGIAAYNKIISDYVSKIAEQSTKVLMTPAEIAAVNAGGGNTLDPRMAYMKTVAPDGRVTGYEALAPRQAFSQLQQENDLRSEYLAHPVVKTYQLAQAIVGRMQGTIAAGETRDLQQPDDMSLIRNFARMNDPNAVVKAGDVEDVMNGAGIPGDIQQAWARVKGGGVLTDNQRQWLIDTARAELGGMAAGALPVLLEKRRIAQGMGIRPDMIGIPEQLSTEAGATLRATPPGAAQPGTPTAPTGQTIGIPRPGVNVPASAPASGAALAPPAPTPLTPPPTAPATGPPAAADRFTPGQWRAFTPAGLANIADDMVKNPGHYSVRDRQRLLEAAQAARPK